MINLQKVAELLQPTGLLNKSFMTMSRDEILTICSAVMSSPSNEVPPMGWNKPYISDQGALIIPYDVHPDYRWWEPGRKSLKKILSELEAPFVLAQHYLGADLTEEQWKKDCLPF